MTEQPTAGFDLTSAAEQMRRLGAGVRDEQLDDPSPCADYDVRALLAHIVGLTGAFVDTARKKLDGVVNLDPSASRPQLPADWRAQLPANIDALIEAWQDPAALGGMTRAGGVDLPGQVAQMVATNELVIHGWDLATATGQAYAPADDSVAASLAMLSDRGTQFQEIFDAPVAVPDDAPLIDQAVGLSGRDPHWTP